MKKDIIHILLVEDDELQVQLVQTVFQAWEKKTEISVAENLGEARRLLRRDTPDVVLADLKLPDGHGTELIPRGESDTSYPVIIMTAYGDERIAVDAIKSGALEYVVKSPKAISRLPLTVERALREWGHIIEKNLALDALKESEKRFSLLFNNSLELFYVLDCDGRFLDINDRALSLLGYDRDEIKTLRLTDILYEEDIPVALRSIDYILINGTAKRSLDFRLKKYDGFDIWIEATGVRMYQADGRISILGLARDITKRKEAEETLRETEEQLRFSQKMDAVGRLAGGIAHDFNNLLSIIMGNCDVISQGLDTGRPLGGNVKEIRQASDRAAELTRQLLAFSRKQVFKTEVLDPNSVVSGMKSMLERLMGEDIILEPRLDENAGFVEADIGQLEQVIMNLAVNARDAMPGGGRLVIEISGIDVDDDYETGYIGLKPGPYVMLSFRDNGLGMDEETLARIYEPFFTTKESGRGTGLGLSTVYGIIAQSNGHIWARSTPGEGSVFRIVLPRVSHAPSEKEIKTDKPVSMSGTGNILLVEDDESLRNLICTMLVSRGYKVLHAPTGHDALEIMNEGKEDIDLLITDVVMPQMSGPELAAKLASQVGPDRVLYISGYSDDERVHEIIRQGRSHYLQKPFSTADIVTKVGGILESSQ